MAMGAVTLRPGVNTQLTQSLNEAGVFSSQLIRYKDSLIQTYGGWVNFVSFTVPSTVREMHAWQGLQSNKLLALGATSNLSVITAGSNSDITPQILIDNPPPNFSISSGSSIVTIVDGNSSASVFNTVYFNTPVALGPYLLNGPYKITSVLGSSIYTISLPAASTATVASSGILPVFNASSGSAIITVTLPNNGFQSVTGLFQQFIAPSSVGGLTVQGPYQISSVIDSTSFTITSITQASTTGTAIMNGGNAQLEYFITIGPPPPGSGFGSGGFGSGGFGTGTPATTGTGTTITTQDWTMDNWGEVLLACPKDGPIYTWSPDSGFQNAQVITQAPFFNGGIFVSMPQQILVAWKSVQSTGVQDPLVIRWCNSGDYTNWTVSNQTTAGSFHLPTGSYIVGAIQGPNQALISTDVDVWVMQYVGGIVIFNFTRAGSGCGWIGSHAAGNLGGITYWCGTTNFYMLGSSGVAPIPCSVWDFIFQNLNAANQTKVRCAVNSAFNEIAWFFPSKNGPGENDSYVKVHIEGQEYEWDYGSLSRTAWVDISVLGAPIGVDTTGTIYQHETGNAISGVGLPSFQTGWWALSEGNDFATVQFVIPDFIWGTQSGPKDAQVNMTFFTTNFPGDTPIQYGPFLVTQATEYINLRARGRLMSVLIQAANAEFFRIGKIRYRYSVSGRR